jgi:N-acetyl-gamma-glutamyl-phosphate reductase
MNVYAFRVNKYPVGILGASGYTGRELVRLVRRHPHLDLAFAAAASRAGETVRVDGLPVTFDAADAARLGDVALVFSALPHGTSGEWVAKAHAAGARVVDLSTDLRPGNARPAALAALAALDAPYGMPELHGAASRAAIAAARVVANPGCYPTATLLALAPLLRTGLVAPDATIVVDAASGVSGAGNSPRADLLFGEVAEDFRAYGTGNAHRHLQEMTATVASLGGGAELLFTPHLLPVARGILATITVPLAAPLADAMAPFRDAYAHEPFVELADAPPTLKDVQHRNVVRIVAQPAAHLSRPHLSVFSAIDNLVKGAAGQAVQNANLMLGLDETAGLR